MEPSFLTHRQMDLETVTQSKSVRIGPASGSPHCVGHSCGWGAGCPVREGPDRGSVPGSAGGAYQFGEDEEALQLCSSLEPGLQGSVPPGPEGQPALPGGWPGAELRRLLQQQLPHTTPGCSSQLIWSLWFFHTQYMKIPLVLGVFSYLQPGSTCGPELHVQAQGSKLPKHFILPASLTIWWLLRCYPKGSALETCEPWVNLVAKV